MNNDQNNKELGLIDILQIMGQWIVSLIKKLADWFLFLVFFGLKRWKVLVIVGVAAGVYSFVTYKMQANQYEANMIIRSNAVESIHMKKFLDGYGNLLGNDLLGDSIIEERTGLDSLQRSLISSLSTYYCVDADKDGIVDVIDRTSRFKSSDEDIDSLNLSVSVRFKDVDVLPLLTKSFISYIENLEFVVNSNDSRLAELNTRKNFIEAEIQLLDTLQKRTYGGMDVENTLRASYGSVLVDNRKVLVYEDKIILLDMLEGLQRDINIYTEPLTIVEDFVIQKSAINSLSSIVKKNVFLSLFGAYLILFIIFLYNKEKGKYLN